MGALGAGIAVFGAWWFAGRMLTADYIRGLDGNRGWAVLAIVFAVVATIAVIDKV
jgi:hypothetical protein